MLYAKLNKDSIFMTGLWCFFYLIFCPPKPPAKWMMYAVFMKFILNMSNTHLPFSRLMFNAFSLIRYHYRDTCNEPFSAAQWRKIGSSGAIICSLLRSSWRHWWRQTARCWFIAMLHSYLFLTDYEKKFHLYLISVCNVLRSF